MLFRCIISAFYCYVIFHYGIHAILEFDFEKVFAINDIECPVV